MHESFNESLHSLNQLTIDELLFMNEQIEIKNSIDEAWDIERKRIEAQNKNK